MSFRDGALRLVLSVTYSAYERGSNKNANRIVRRFYPKGTDFTTLCTADLRRLLGHRASPRRRTSNLRLRRGVGGAC